MSMNDGALLGVLKPLPPRGFPAGRIRYRMRVNDFIWARVFGNGGIREFPVREVNGCWVPILDCERGRNLSVGGSYAEYYKLSRSEKVENLAGRMAAELDEFVNEARRAGSVSPLRSARALVDEWELLVEEEFDRGLAELENLKGVRCE